MRAKFAVPAFVAALLALPAVASAAEVALTVHKAGTGTGTVECEAEEGREPCKAKYPTGTELFLFAEPDQGSEFVKWSGACLGAEGAEECALTMNAAKTVTATFDLVEYLLTVTKNGTGTGTVECEAGEGREPCKAKYPEGTELTLLAEPKPGSELVEWSGDCFGEEEKCELTMEEDSSVTATFDLEPTLTVTKNGTGAGTVKCEAEVGPETCKTRYPKETQLTLLAEPNSGSTFAGFSAGTGSATGCSPSPCSFTLTANSSVTATFNLEAPTKPNLKVLKAGTGTGTVSGGSPAEPSTISCGATCEHEYLSGAVVTLTAAASGGSTFGGWSGAGCSGTGTCKVTMSAVKEVTAEFKLSANPMPTPTPTPTPEPEKETPEPEKEGAAKAAGTASYSGGKAALKLTCSGGACQGTLKLTAKVKQGKKTKNVVIGQASFSLAAGASSTLKVKLSGAAKQKLGKGKTLKAKLSGTGITGSTVKIKPA